MKSGVSGAYSSSGNLIISGEYFVLIGAKALAVPLKYGQQMRVECIEDTHQMIKWEAFESGEIWFSAEFETEKMTIKSSADRAKTIRLQKLLRYIRDKKPELFKDNRSFVIVCDINFNRNWGWGTSSTLICNLADWSGIDAFELNSVISHGSGYDIAASRSSTPIYFRIENGNHIIDHASFAPVFKDSLFFLFSGKKQNTDKSITKNINLVRKNYDMVPMISWLTEKIATETDTAEFMRYIAEHEKIISKTLNMKRIKEMYFNDFDGELKSLGAWGGDFILVVSQMRESEIREYFSSRGLEILFRFDELIRN
jgi:mevalonate kinase